MVCIRVRADHIVKSLHSLMLQIILYKCTFIIISRIDQHRMAITFDQSRIPLSHIYKMYFQITCRLCLLRIIFFRDSLTTLLCLTLFFVFRRFLLF